jgi:undecaprenyl-diphosphatase
VTGGGSRSENRPQREEHEPFSVDKRKALIAVVLALLLAGGAFAVVGQVAHFGELRRAFRHADKLWLPVCAVGQLLAYLGYILAYHAVARASGGPRFGWAATARIVIFGAGASVLSASVGGLAVDFWALRRTGTPRHVAVRRVLAVGTIEWTVLSVYALIAAIVVLAAGPRSALPMALAWLCAVPTCVAAAAWFTSPVRVERYTNRLLRPATSRGGGSDAPARGGLTRLLDKLRAGGGDAIAGVILVRHLLSHPVRYLGGAIGYPIYWGGDILTLFAAVHAFGVSVGVVPLILAYASAIVVSALPLPAGGAGGVEVIESLALHAVGVPLAPALLAVFLYRIITFWLPVIPSLLVIPAIRRLHDTLRTVPHTRRDPDEKVSFRPPADAAA